MFKKLKSISLASFQAEMGRDSLENREKKIFRSDPFLLDPSQKIPKKKKFIKLKNIILASLQAETGWERLKNREKKISFQSVPTRPELENSKIIGKKFKNLKTIILASFHAETGWDRPKNRGKKNRSDPFLLDLSKEIKKKQ